MIAILTILALVGVAGAIFLADSDSDESADIQVVERSDDGSAPGSTPADRSDDDATASGAADEIDDVRSCTWVGDEVVIELVNNSSTTSNDVITTAYLDDDGNRVGDEGHFLNSVRPGESAPGDVTSFSDAVGIVSCDVVGVTRNEAR